MSKTIYQELEDLASLAGRHTSESYVVAIRVPAASISRRLREVAKTIADTGFGTALSLTAADNLLELVPIAKRLARWKAIPQLAHRGRKIAASIQRIAAELILAGIEHGNVTLAQEPQS